MIKGVPQGSVLGSLLFNSFLNDIYFILSYNISIYSYVDDNRIGSFDEGILELKRNLEMSADVTLIWFHNNQIMMTSSNGNIFRVTGPLCGEFTGPGEFPTQRPVTRSFDVFFDLRLNKRLNKQSWGWWFETLSRPFWRHRNVKINPEKFQTLVVKQESEVNDTELNISGQTIKPTSCVELLGVFIDYQLSLDKYGSELCIRAARKTNALRRIVKFLSPEYRITMNTVFIASNFNYCNIVWHFCGHTNSLKRMCTKSLNVVLNDYLSPDLILLEKEKRPTMYVSRMKSIGLEVFKCLHKCKSPYINDMFSISASP